MREIETKLLVHPPNIIRVIEYGRGGQDCGADGEENKMHMGFWKGNLKERDYLEVLGVDGRIILKWILKKQEGVDWAHLA
jgi:hypothetical protein